ncbi:hypothetical protein QFC22_000181 [Naganishia vaughanmartiniae]|uniref:Uncharacterized protein n=1 Tax=Naganishia vaughanmartiniae TaxID=1424756 RepID=A0ACC2XNM1_9TREE|nr:hypothetical protein QFC22_000181 [Naganishia vaughanmartiniae]
MSLSYLVSTAGHAQYQNEVYPHRISSLTQLIREGAEELGDRHVVGFAEPLKDDNGKDIKDAVGQLQWHLAASADKHAEGIPTIRLPAVTAATKTCEETSKGWPADPMNPAQALSHIFHTSGTSGTPKPIPQTHSSSVRPLPRRKIGDPDTLTSSFTTTPLFHGGVSDLLRSWMARSMLYLYPSSTTPVTASNVTGAFQACESYDSGATYTPPIKAFLSVPYILTLLSPVADPSDATGATAMLADMSIVSTGGAPLDTAVGNALVSKGVNLTSRLGSSECGFLMTSYRDYENDKEWEWLHNDSPYASALKFEESESDPTGGKLEMIVTSEWKSKVKSNRENGDYATGDLYERHPEKPNVWKYAGRGDDVVVLSNGEKFSPSPIEAVFRSSADIKDALVVGVNKTQIGCLIFPRAGDSLSKIEAELQGLIESANEQSPSHAQLAKEMCTVIPSEHRANDLPKSSKGTLQRGLAYEEFKPEIERLFKQAEGGGVESGEKLQLVEPELRNWLKNRVEELIGPIRRSDDDEQLQADTDLFSWGVDSVKAARLRSAILQNIDLAGNSLPLNVVFENASITQLADLCVSLRTGQQHRQKTLEDDIKLMREMVNKYSDFELAESDQKVRRELPALHASTGRTVVLTGATGSLGSHLLHQLSLLPTSAVEKIICLVRGADDAVAYDRVQKALAYRNLSCQPDRFQVLSARLGKVHLGMDDAVYQSLSQKTDIVIHAAWAVHFGSRLESFEGDHIRGARNLLDLIANSSASQPRFLFCSSIASVLNGVIHSDIVYEKLSEDPHTAVPIGYSQSKWVTEQICANANESTMFKDKVQVLRIGQLCGDTQEGMWNESEGWPLMIKSAQITGALPLIQDNPSWLPVDVAAKAVIDIALKGKTCHKGRLPVFHVANPQLTTWQEILDGLAQARLHFSTVSPREWVQKVKESEGDAGTNPIKGMLGMWENAYGQNGVDRPAPTVKSKHATNVSPDLSASEPVSRELIGRMVKAWRKSGFLE